MIHRLKTPKYRLIDRKRQDDIMKNKKTLRNRVFVTVLAGLLALVMLLGVVAPLFGRM